MPLDSSIGMINDMLHACADPSSPGFSRHAVNTTAKLVKAQRISTARSGDVEATKEEEEQKQFLGRATFRMQCQEGMANQLGNLHGGCAATMADLFTSLAVSSISKNEKACSVLSTSLTWFAGNTGCTDLPSRRRLRSFNAMGHAGRDPISVPSLPSCGARRGVDGDRMQRPQSWKSCSRHDGECRDGFAQDLGAYFTDADGSSFRFWQGDIWLLESEDGPRVKKATYATHTKLDRPAPKM